MTDEPSREEEIMAGHLRDRLRAEIRVERLGPGYPKEFCFEVISGGAIKRAVEAITPEIWAMPCQMLARRIVPTNVRFDIKERFWKLTARAFVLGQKFTIKNLHAGICSYTNLYNHFLRRPEVVAWMLKCNVPGVEERIDFTQLHAMNIIWDVMMLPIDKDDGSPDYSAIKLKIKVYEAMAPTADWYIAKERIKNGGITVAEIGRWRSKPD